jgi:hypothetical protein
MPTAIPELAAQMNDTEDIERARSAKRDLWKLVRHAGRPGADDERGSLAAMLADLLRNDPSTVVGREVLWMLSEIGGDDCVEAMAALLKHADLREDARMALERIPGEVSLAALKTGLQSAPDDFQLNIAQSLRARGVEVPGLPCVKLKPTKPTGVKPVGRET